MPNEYLLSFISGCVSVEMGPSVLQVVYGARSKEHANQQSLSPPSTQQHANCLLVQAEGTAGGGDTGAGDRLLIVVCPQHECTPQGVRERARVFETLNFF